MSQLTDDREALVRRLSEALMPASGHGDFDRAAFWRVFGACGGWDVFDRGDPAVRAWGDRMLALLDRQHARREAYNRAFAAEAWPLMADLADMTWARQLLPHE